MQKEEDAEGLNPRAPGRVKKLRIDGAPVKKDLWLLTLDILAEFCKQTDKRLAPLTNHGRPSNSAKRIYMRVSEFPNLSLRRHSEVIANTLASEWWGDDAPSIGVVYGPNVFEENVERKPKKAKKSKFDRFDKLDA